MNWKEIGRKRSWPNFKVFSRHSPEETGENDENLSNVVVELLSLLLHIQVVQVSNLGLEMAIQILELGNDRFLPNPFQFIIYFFLNSLLSVTESRVLCKI
jgi:hypothetical protein